MKVVSVKFKENGRAYYFDPGEFKIKEGDFVVVTTARGTECGEVVRAAHEVPGFSREVKPVIRVADAVDVRRMRQNRADVQQLVSEEFGTGLTIIDAHGFYSDTPKTVLYVVVNRFQTVKLKTLVKGVDANAYMAISPVADLLHGSKEEETA